MAAARTARRVHDALLFPLWLTSLQPDYLLTYRLAPLAADRTLVVAEIHVHPARGPAGVDLADVFAFWDRTNAEDRAICERQQQRPRARAVPAPARYATSEDGLHAFERLVAARYLARDGRRSAVKPRHAPLWGIFGRPYLDLEGADRRLAPWTRSTTRSRAASRTSSRATRAAP